MKPIRRRSSIFNEDFKKEVGEDNFVKHYAAITNKKTLAEAAQRLDEGGEEYVTKWLSKKAVHMDTVDTVARSGGKQIKANKSITVYPRLQLSNDIQLAMAQGRILDITKKRRTSFCWETRVQSPSVHTKRCPQEEYSTLLDECQVGKSKK